MEDDTPLARAIRTGEGNDQYLWALLRGIARVGARVDRDWGCDTYWNYKLHRYCPAEVHTSNPWAWRHREQERRRRMRRAIEEVVAVTEKDRQRVELMSSLGWLSEEVADPAPPVPERVPDPGGVGEVLVDAAVLGEQGDL